MAERTGRDDAIDAEAREIPVEDTGVLAAITSAEIDKQIETAKRWPRSIKQFKVDLLELATLDEMTAGSMFYRLPRDQKLVEGPSVRLAEAAVSSWGNLHAAARIVAEEERFIVAQALAWDLQKNVRIGMEVRRRIWGKKGRFTDDMITTTCNAACSIAFRNAVFKVIPVALMREAFEEAKQVSVGKGLSMEQRRENAFKALAKVAGAKEKDVLFVIGRAGADDITIDDLITLRGMYTAIQDGETTWAHIIEDVQAQSDAPKPRLASDILKQQQNPDKPSTAGGAPEAGGDPPQPNAKDSATADSKPPPKAADPDPDQGFQASTDGLSPEQKSALATSIGRARLKPKDVADLCRKYDAVGGDITTIKFGRYKELTEELINLGSGKGF